MIGRDTMYGVDWHTSEREYDVTKREVLVPVDNGTELSCQLFLPNAEGEFPTIVGAHPYDQDYQTDAPLSVGTAGSPGWSESGDPAFYVRRGYAMANVNVRGTGDSGGYYQFGGHREAEDVRDVIEWLAAQSWSDGSVGTFGMSYYAMNAYQVAMLNPEPLECLFSPYGLTDWYRHLVYREGLLAKDWLTGWSRHLDDLRVRSQTRADLDDEEFEARIERARGDPELVADAEIAEALEHPDEHPFLIDILLHHLDDEFWADRRVGYEETSIPAYVGADWNDTALHLRGAFRTWERWSGPKKLVVGPIFQPDRPLYQFHYESLRWFDHWLKGIDTKIMEEPDIRLFVPPRGNWRAAENWPLPETTWTPFYLHGSSFLSDHDSAVGLLSEHEIFGDGGADSFSDSRYEHGALWYETPPVVEETLVCGPILFNLYASVTSDEALFFATLYERDPDGERTEVTRGWLRGSQRRIDEAKSDPWWAHHPHDEREPLTPGAVHEFNVNVGPTAIHLRPGHRLGLRIKCSDRDDADDELARISGQGGSRIGHVATQAPRRVTVYRDEEHPSHVMLPVVEGNIVGTYLSGAKYDEAPYRRHRRP